MYKILLIALGVISLSACTEQLNSQSFSCDSQLSAVITSNDEESATLNYNQVNHSLTKQISASGVKYTNEDVLFWTKGNEAMLIIDGNKYHCNLE
ncbi:MAG: membrane-bound inhibitor of C-type lysozyme [Pseudoalteromonas rhizosphaerae]|jgi:membrane-bound inhibitor of C-type lysozyme|uniref:Lysozyme inhibitor n=1 Tax=Pseudoalteromonas neustonica TaxID=1840331 RepID=A0ABY3FCM2_9GAMM|nr:MULTISPECIES: MliC family protein [Pseudoalteromonas]MBB1292496.1 MliC family protein [Pseudoalteromonas sp. SR41-4]TVU81922.1 lysozyme inhibitor [Pseudoalteromonas neustonica]